MARDDDLGVPNTVRAHYETAGERPGSNPMTKSSPKYLMTISRLTVDKLGVRLYDRVSAVIAELVANSYDADATVVKISAPMDQWLASKLGGVITDKGFKIEVADDGVGMSPDQINEFYLRVGAELAKTRSGATGQKSSSGR